MFQQFNSSSHVDKEALWQKAPKTGFGYEDPNGSNTSSTVSQRNKSGLTLVSHIFFFRYLSDSTMSHVNQGSYPNILLVSTTIKSSPVPCSRPIARSKLDLSKLIEIQALQMISSRGL